MRYGYIALLFLLSLISHSSLVAAADFDQPRHPHIIVSGYGALEQIPDVINVRFTVSATATSLALAKQQVDTIVGKAIKAARQQSVDKEHINASKINASPQYEWVNNQRQYRGEQVNRLVEVKLVNAERYNDLIEGLLAAGISQLQPVELSYSNRETLEAKALTLALDDARQKASLMAEHLGSKVGRVYQIAPQQHHSPISRLAMSARESSAKDAAPLSLGKQTIEQQVQVIFLLAQ